MRSPAVSEVYQPVTPNTVQDEPFVSHYPEQGYSIAYELDAHGQQTPEGGNTALFRIFPHGVTEPVYVTKPQAEATFTVRVLSGSGLLIRALASGEVEQVPLHANSEMVIHPGEAYAYQNTSDDEDLMLHDVALPAFQAGDDVDLRSSQTSNFPPETPGGYSSVVAKVGNGERVVSVPDEFTELMTNAYRQLRTERQRQTRNFFAELSTRIEGVPELKMATDYAAENPEQAYKLFNQYIQVVQKIARLSPEEMDQIRQSWERLQTMRSSRTSASNHNALDILALLDDDARTEMAEETTRPMDTSSPYLEPALTDFIARTEGGHQMLIRGETPQDGDPESDRVIWSHTQITNPEAMLHFTLAHYLERYFSQTLAAQGVTFAAHSKDYFLGAMTDVLLLDHYGAQRFSNILDMWAKPKDQGGLGWTSDTRFTAYNPASDQA